MLYNTHLLMSKHWPQNRSKLSSKNILVVDDTIGIRTLMRTVLEHAGFCVCGEASNGIEAIEAALRLKPDLILIDYSMPLMNGAEASSILKHRQPDTPVILFTLHADDVGQAMKMAFNVDLVIGKLDGMDKLIGHINTLLDKPHSRSASARLL